MPRAPLPLSLALLALLPGPLAAGPPEPVGGKMAFYEVADGLRKYRAEKDPERRDRWLRTLAGSRDVRVEVVLGELREAGVADGASEAANRLGFEAHCLLARHYGLMGYSDAEIRRWWADNEADLRRRASQLPR